MLKITLMPKMTLLGNAQNNTDAKNDIVVKIGTGPVNLLRSMIIIKFIMRNFIVSDSSKNFGPVSFYSMHDTHQNKQVSGQHTDIISLILQG